MKVDEKKLDDGSMRLTVDATAKEVDDALERAQTAIASHLGLRPDPGKNVTDALKAHFGVDDIDSVVQPQAVNILVPYALDQKNITPLAQPKALPATGLHRGRPLTFQVDVIPKPHFELSSYEPVRIEVPEFVMPEFDVDEEIRSNFNMYPDFVTAAPHPVGPDDSCLIAMEMRFEGQRLDGISTDGRIYSVGKGFMPESFDDNVIGMDVGETKTFSFVGESTDRDGKTVSREYECTVTVKEIKEEVMPELTDEWVRKVMPSYDSIDALRADVAKGMKQQAKHDHEMQVMTIAQTELAERLIGEIPDAAFEPTAASIEATLRNQLSQQGVSLTDFIDEQGGEQNYKIGIMMQAKQTLRCDYALDALFEHENLVLTDEDIDGACAELNPMYPSMVRKEMESTGRGFALREVAARYAASRYLVDNAIITTISE